VATVLPATAGAVASSSLSFGFVTLPLARSPAAMGPSAVSVESIWPTGTLTVPVKVGLARGAFASRAVWVAVETGLAASLVLSTLLRLRGGLAGSAPGT